MGFIGTTELVVISVAALFMLAPALSMKYIKTYKRAKQELKENDIFAEKFK